VLLSEYELSKPEVVHECLVVNVPQQSRQLDFIHCKQLAILQMLTDYLVISLLSSQHIVKSFLHEVQEEL